MSRRDLLWRGSAWNRQLLALCTLMLAAGLATACDDDDDDDQQPSDTGSDVVSDAGLDADDTGDATEDDADVGPTPDAGPDVGPIPEGVARLQIIHNSPDPLASTVDIYFNGIKIEDLAYKSATAFIDVEPGNAVVIAVAGSDSDSPEDALATFGPLLIEEQQSYVIMATGVLTPEQFQPNPEGRDIAFDLIIRADARQASSEANTNQALVFHGVTDAPAINLIANNGAPTLNPATANGTRRMLAENLPYGEFTTEYLNLPTGVTVLDVVTGTGGAGGNEQILGHFQTPALGRGEAYTIVATGFADPAQNPDAPFNLMAFPTRSGNSSERIQGTILPRAARVQAVHNAPEPQAQNVDVFMMGQRAITGLQYRQATPFLTVPSGMDIATAIVRTGTAQEQAIWNGNVRFEPGIAYQTVASGVLNPANLVGTPAGQNPTFGLRTTNAARERAVDPQQVEFFLFHGIPNAPAVDVIVANTDPVTVLADNLAFGQFTEYRVVPPGAYNVQLTDADNNSNVLYTFSINMAGLGNSVTALHASGTLNGPEAFSPVLMAVQPDGQVRLVNPLDGNGSAP